jgi:hypothetical protein
MGILIFRNEAPRAKLRPIIFIEQQSRCEIEVRLGWLETNYGSRTTATLITVDCHTCVDRLLFLNQGTPADLDTTSQPLRLYFTVNWVFGKRQFQWLNEMIPREHALFSFGAVLAWFL